MILSRKSRIVYFWGFLILLLAETGIAVYLKTGFIRANAGDFLVALLLYCLLMFCTKLPDRIDKYFAFLFFGGNASDCKPYAFLFRRK